MELAVNLHRWILIQATYPPADVLTSECSMLLMSKAPFDLHDLQRMLSLVDDLRGRAGGSDPLQVLADQFPSDPEVSCSPGPACILCEFIALFHTCM